MGGRSRGKALPHPLPSAPPPPPRSRASGQGWATGISQAASGVPSGLPLRPGLLQSSRGLFRVCIGVSFWLCFRGLFSWICNHSLPKAFLTLLYEFGAAEFRISALAKRLPPSLPRSPSLISSAPSPPLAPQARGLQFLYLGSLADISLCIWVSASELGP